MNTFNSFQAVAFYTALPIAIQWLFENNHDVFAYMLSAGLAIGFVILSVSVSENFK